MPRSWDREKLAWLRALTLTGCVHAVCGHGVFLHSLGAGGELREAGHEGAQHQNEAQGCHLGVERVVVRPGGAGTILATPILLPPKPTGIKISVVFQESSAQTSPPPRCVVFRPFWRRWRGCSGHLSPLWWGATTDSARKRGKWSTRLSPIRWGNQETEKGVGGGLGGTEHHTRFSAGGAKSHTA